MANEGIKERLKERVEGIIQEIEEYKAKTQEERRAWELVVLMTQCISAMVAVADEVLDTAADKLDAVKEAATEIWDEHLAPLDIPLIPDFIERYVDDYVVRILIEIAVGLRKKGLLN